MGHHEASLLGRASEKEHLKADGDGKVAQEEGANHEHCRLERLTLSAFDPLSDVLSRNGAFVSSWDENHLSVDCAGHHSRHQKETAAHQSEISAAGAHQSGENVHEPSQPGDSNAGAQASRRHKRRVLVRVNDGHATVDRYDQGRRGRPEAQQEREQVVRHHDEAARRFVEENLDGVGDQQRLGGESD